MPHSPQPLRVLILFSDTGGGHRSAAVALEEALQLEYRGRLVAERVDFLKDYAPYPFSRLPALYSAMVERRRLWRAAFHASDGRRRIGIVTGLTWPIVRRAARRLLADHPADVVVAVHALAVAPFLGALRRGAGEPGVAADPGFAVVVTDLGSVHAFWFDRRADLVCVPDMKALRHGAACGVTPERLIAAGLPVARRFEVPTRSCESLRHDLGWPDDRPMVLLTAGGEGMGVLETVAAAIDAAELRCGLAVVTGRNQGALERLRLRPWKAPTFVYGFVDQMDQLMHAADVLVTKAGPSTVSEALVAGLPMVLYDRLPGHEDGNAEFVVEGGAGIWAPRPREIVAALRSWLADPVALARAGAACRALARPEAAREIARAILTRCTPGLDP